MPRGLLFGPDLPAGPDRLDLPPMFKKTKRKTKGKVKSRSKGESRSKVQRARKGEERKKKREEWLLVDVIFVEDSKNVPVGKVLKVDGPYCAVRFPPASKDKDKEDESIISESTRLMRKAGAGEWRGQADEDEQRVV